MDRADFVARLAVLCRARAWKVYAWALLPNHFHLRVGTGEAPLFRSMKKGGKVIDAAGLREDEFRSGLRRPDSVRAPQPSCQVAVKAMGHPGAEVARFLGITTSSANRLAVSEELPEFRRFLNAL